MRSSRSAFSLIELLVVIAIIAVLAGLVSMSLSGVASSGTMAQASAQIRGTVEIAREAAVATGTYHYVGLRNDADAFEIVTFRSLDGALPGGNYAVPDSDDPPRVEQSGKRVRVQSLIIEDSLGDLSDFVTTPSGPLLEAAGKTSDATVTFSLTTGGETSDFDRVIQVSPRGQARVPGGNPASAIKVFLSPAGAGAPALVFVHTDTGFVEEFR